MTGGSPTSDVGRHGAAGYVSGCRCSVCWQAQRLREHQIGIAETERWEQINIEAEAKSPCAADLAANGGGPWTDADLAVAMDASLTPAQAAALLGRTASAVKNRRGQQRGGLGLRRRWSPAEIAALADDSVTAAELGRQLGRTKIAVHEARKLYLPRQGT
ncbi:hypothetical protein [Mycobacteroides salmoniphilum]|uniref:hypothetical protein n=1 Tax=Mycobacteroides salmoniphilum TaxID=404941 RepID=UPI0012FF6CA4|nr:hypothetical protein [Mycobacteroides salmoniphilum]